MSVRHIVLAITGASGACYGVRLIRELLSAGCKVSLLISAPGFTLLKEECDFYWKGEASDVNRIISEYFQPVNGMLQYYEQNDFLAPIASGSSAPDAMVICPCTMGTVGRIAGGLSGNLIERVADVVIKEKRQLLLIPRETPLSAIHLENMLKLSRLGVVIMPAMPAFYQRPESIDDLIAFLVGKVLDQLGLKHTLYRRWGA